MIKFSAIGKKYILTLVLLLCFLLQNCTAPTQCAHTAATDAPKPVSQMNAGEKEEYRKEVNKFRNFATLVVFLTVVGLTSNTGGGK